MTEKRWTDDDLALMHQVGRDYEHGQMATLADELHSAPPLGPLPVPYEQRVQGRIDDMVAGRNGAPDHPGGPVAWQPGWTPGTGDPP